MADRRKLRFLSELWRDLSCLAVTTTSLKRLLGESNPMNNGMAADTSTIPGRSKLHDRRLIICNHTLRCVGAQMNLCICN